METQEQVQWIVFDSDIDDQIHILPSSDILEHTLCEICHCNPIYKNKDEYDKFQAERKLWVHRHCLTERIQWKWLHYLTEI